MCVALICALIIISMTDIIQSKNIIDSIFISMLIYKMFRISKFMFIIILDCR